MRLNEYFDCLYKYYDYLKSKYIENKYTVLIDHSHTGQSITSFSKILNRYFNYIDRNDMNPYSYEKSFDFINLISPLQMNGLIQKPDSRYINTLGYIIIPHLVEIANEKIPRTIHHYPHWKWSESNSDKDFIKIDILIRKEFYNRKIITDEVRYECNINKYNIDDSDIDEYDINEYDISRY